jgi:two-component system, NarL family, response regulator DevR
MPPFAGQITRGSPASPAAPRPCDGRDVVSAAVDDPLIGVLIVDDHDMVAKALAAALDDGVSFTVVGIAHTRAAAMSVLMAQAVDVVVLDLRLADGDDTTSFIPDILLAAPDTKVLVLSAWGDDWSVSRSVEMGCHGYLLKEQGLDDLVDGIRAVARGEATFAPAVLSRVLKLLRPGTTTSESLTSRETEVLRRLADGLTTEQIAADLYVSVNTVRNHVNNIIRKLNVHSRLEAVSFAIRNGLIRVG